MAFGEVFRSDGTDTSMQHRLAWSLITISGLFADNYYCYYYYYHYYYYYYILCIRGFS